MKNERPKRPEYLKAGLERLVDRMAITPDVFDPGLESIIAAETAIADVDEQLLYRGYPITEVAKESSALEVAYLLIEGELPSLDFLADFQTLLFEDVVDSATVRALLAAGSPAVKPEAFLSSLFGLAGDHRDHDEESELFSPIAEVARLMALATIGLSKTCVSAEGDVQDHEPTLDSDLSFAANLLFRVTGKMPSEAAERAFDAALILLAEHGVDASAFAARVVVSSDADFHGAISAAAVTFFGAVHAGPRAEVIEPLFEFKTVDEVTDYLEKCASARKPIDGFDSRSNGPDDTRLELLRDLCDEMASETDRRDFEKIARCFEEAVRGQFGLGPTIHWHLSRLFDYLGVPRSAFRSVAAIGRLPGWVAHAVEQRSHNQLIRPRGRYVGPARRPLPDFSSRG